MTQPRVGRRDERPVDSAMAKNAISRMPSSLNLVVQEEKKHTLQTRQMLSLETAMAPEGS